MSKTRKSALAKILTAAVLLVVAVIFAGRVHAGAQSDFGVTVNTVARSATGHAGGAFNSADTVQYIGCTIDTVPSVWCYAKSSSGVTANCSVAVGDIDKYSKAVAAIDSDSYLSFKWDVNNVCTYLAVANASYYAPKQYP